VLKLETTGAIAGMAGACVQTVRAYADKGLIPFERDNTGRRLFDPTVVVPIIKLLLAQRRPWLKARQDAKAAA